MIFDAYMAAFEKMQREEAEEAAKGKKGEKKPAQIVQVTQEDPVYSASMKRCLKIMERLIVQNANEERFMDYKYESLTMDETIPGQQSTVDVLPLWRFTTEKGRRKHVTSIAWNPRYKDLFGVSYGSYDFLYPKSGLICCYTIKNFTWPEYQFSTESGVMCIDFHPDRAALIAAGCYDGTVMVFDIRHKDNKPIYQSTVRTAKHTDPVWQVRWQPEEAGKTLNFYSISSDGRVTNWQLMKNKLEAEEVIKLKLVVDQDKELQDNKKEAFTYGLAGGMCFDFNPYHDSEFLVGTEEGKIHLCSKAFSGQYLETYEGHYLAVYAVKWNTFDPKVFLSCSADWTIKMWMVDMTRPIVRYDLRCPVGDIQWAPYSSTVFAAVTSEGQLKVYDLNQEKHRELCNFTAIGGKQPALHVSFNKHDPIILVGDERSGVNSFKLSNILYQGPVHPDPEKDVGKTVQQMEIAKLGNFLNSMDKVEY
jgi:dynein intermediate chain 1